MKKLLLPCLIIVTIISAEAQLSPLTVEKIMRDPKWIGTSPSSPQWSEDGQRLYFSWNPDKNLSDSTYYITTGSLVPVKASVQIVQDRNSTGNFIYNNNRTAYIYGRDGDVFYVDAKTNRTRRITETLDTESNPHFSFNETKVVYNRSQNLYAWDILTGETLQLTNVRTGGGSSGSGAGQGKPTVNLQEDWLRNDQLRYFEVLRDRKYRKDQADAYNRTLPKAKEMRSISLDDRTIQGLSVSPDGRFVTYRLFRPAQGAKSTIVPNYITESGFTTDIPARTKVGAATGTSEFYIYDRQLDSIFSLKPDSLAGIKEIPMFFDDYPAEKEKRKKMARAVTFGNASWSPNGERAIIEARSSDNKDRWIISWNAKTGRMENVDRQRDEAWIGGPGIGFRGGWIDNNRYWFQSEKTGYSHIYIHDFTKGNTSSLTSGKFEVLQAQLSRDKKSFYVVTNEIHPGEQHLYKLDIADGKLNKLTSMTGANQVTVSPDEKYFAILHSYSTKPWELYLQENKAGAKPVQVTNKGMSDEFRSYPWRDPEVITFKAADGASVYARLYKPSNPHPSKPAVLFVHGAGYLQNAHKWWSSYFREYMFNNLLADQGYYVLDVDYRGSAGYGRDWRTGIYRFMGGKDMTDHVDAVNYLIKNHGVNPKNVGLYGGSYGGFITLMGMFNYPEVFKSGAALRPVTDWAQYNHGYTSNILNEPFTDSIAYRKSSPLYYAEGLKGNLLICHGMVDVNVHFQDVVKLAQRLIELGKDNWELAVYPVEDHGFVEPSSWTDEYKRILKLFETTLK